MSSKGKRIKRRGEKELGKPTSLEDIGNSNIRIWKVEREWTR